jgi:hypothetical protein
MNWLSSAGSQSNAACHVIAQGTSALSKSGWTSIRAHISCAPPPRRGGAPPQYIAGERHPHPASPRRGRAARPRAGRPRRPRRPYLPPRPRRRRSRHRRRRRSSCRGEAPRTRSGPRGRASCITSEREDGREAGRCAHPSKMPHEHGNGARASARGTRSRREHVVRPVSSSYVAFGRRAGPASARAGRGTGTGTHYSGARRASRQARHRRRSRRS